MDKDDKDEKVVYFPGSDPTGPSMTPETFAPLADSVPEEVPESVPSTDPEVLTSSTSKEPELKETSASPEDTPATKAADITPASFEQSTLPEAPVYPEATVAIDSQVPQNGATKTGAIVLPEPAPTSEMPQSGDSMAPSPQPLSSPRSSPDAHASTESKKKRRKLILEIAIGVLIAVLGHFVISKMETALDFFANMTNAPEELHILQESTIPDLTSRIETLEGDIKELDKKVPDDIDGSISDVGERVDRLYDIVILSLGLEASKMYYAQIMEGLGSKSSMDLNVGPTIKPMSIVARSSGGVDFTAEELTDIKLLLPYKDGSKNCYFYGKFNENNHWDGNCVVNIYENGVLELITDAVYDDGNLISCKQVFPDYTTGTKDPIWVVSDRVIENDDSRGETWHYYRDADFPYFPEPENVTARDIYSADDFRKKITSDVEGYYNGRTKNGRFNDGSGNAYIIKYFRNGLIRTLYAGNFKNGQFDDVTGNAWMIGKDSEFQAAYSYYKGPFNDGKSVSNGEYWDYPLEQSDVDTYVRESGIDFEPALLRWEHPRT